MFMSARACWRVSYFYFYFFFFFFCFLFLFFFFFFLFFLLYFSERFQKKIIIGSLTPTHMYIQVPWSAYPWIGENIARKS